MFAPSPKLTENLIDKKVKCKLECNMCFIFWTRFLSFLETRGNLRGKLTLLAKGTNWRLEIGLIPYDK